MQNRSIPVREITKENPYKIVFVCLGNICRSPTGEGIMQHLVNEQGFQSYFFIDSAGTSAWHSGEPANSKSRQVAKSHGVDLLSRARQVVASDLDEFDLIIAMDKNNWSDIRSLNPKHNGDNIFLMRDFDSKPENGNVPDPYYGGLGGFENVFQIVKRSCENLLEILKPHIK